MPPPQNRPLFLCPFCGNYYLVETYLTGTGGRVLSDKLVSEGEAVAHRLSGGKAIELHECDNCDQDLS